MLTRDLFVVANLIVWKSDKDIILEFFEPHRRYKIPTGTRLARALYTPGGMLFANFDRNRRLFRKRYEICPWLLWITNGKS